LPDAYREQLDLARASAGDRFPAPAGRALILAGSCSAATRTQVEVARRAGMPVFRIDPIALASGELQPQTVVAWALAQDEAGPVLVYSSAEPDEVHASQEKLGRERAGDVVEHDLEEIARALTSAGFTRLIVAGGETSGAVVSALGIEALAIGPEIDPGVPWTRAMSGLGVALALKSGNFGSPDFFLKAWDFVAPASQR
jgi:uncharacterized protein YgbK (DUF1537 family)